VRLPWKLHLFPSESRRIEEDIDALSPSFPESICQLNADAFPLLLPWSCSNHSLPAALAMVPLPLPPAPPLQKSPKPSKITWLSQMVSSSHLPRKTWLIDKLIQINLLLLCSVPHLLICCLSCRLHLHHQCPTCPSGDSWCPQRLYSSYRLRSVSSNKSGRKEK